MKYYLQNSYRQLHAGLDNSYDFICPEKLYLDLTEDCNLWCQMCRNERIISGKTMPMDLFKRIVNETCPFVRSYSLFNWGESLLLEDFRERVIYINERKRADAIVDISTNGMLLNEDVSDFLYKNQIAVTVSFDGADKVTFEKIRRGAGFEKIIKNVEVLVNTYSGSPLTHSPSIYISIQKDNENQLLAITKIAFNLGIRRIGFGIVTHPVEFACNENEALCKELEQVYSYVRANKMLCEVCPTKVGEYVLAGDKYEHIGDYVLGTKCDATMISATIDYRGDVYLCCNIGALVGNVSNKSFLELWQSELYNQLRQDVNNAERMPQNCKACAWVNRN